MTSVLVFAEKMALVGNKKDLKHLRAVNGTMHKQFADENNLHRQGGASYHMNCFTTRFSPNKSQ